MHEAPLQRVSQGPDSVETPWPFDAPACAKSTKNTVKLSNSATLHSWLLPGGTRRTLKTAKCIVVWKWLPLPFVEFLNVTGLLPSLGPSWLAAEPTQPDRNQRTTRSREPGSILGGACDPSTHELLLGLAPVPVSQRPTEVRDRNQN